MKNLVSDERGFKAFAKPKLRDILWDRDVKRKGENDTVRSRLGAALRLQAANA